MSHTETTKQRRALTPEQVGQGDGRLGPIDRLCKQAVERRLDGLSQGCVRLIDHGQQRVLGQASDGVCPSIHVHDAAFYRRSVLGGGLGFAEAYLDGDWDSDDLTALLRVFVRDIQVAHENERGLARLREPLRRVGGLLQRNSRIGSRRNIAAHYDLGNALFGLFLDETMTYSCGIFDSSETTLGQASINKLDRICKKLDLSPADHVLETGTGWGSFAIHAARNYGCRVTTTTISAEQHAFAKREIERAGMQDRITLLLEDYRDLTGSYDKLVSIEMIEAVGHGYLDTYLGACSRLLRPDGQMLLQVISMPDQRYGSYLRTTDFIQKHVFPGSCCPSLGAVAASVARSTDLRSVQYEDLTPHYVTTLGHWRSRFKAQQDMVLELGYPERFIRLWNYYLSYCQAGFAERYIGVGQMLLNKPRCQRVTPLAEIVKGRAQLAGALGT